MIDLRLFGDPQVIRDGVSVMPARKPLAVLAYMVLTAPGRVLRRDTLLGVFWPDRDQSRARGALRQVLRLLRRDLGDDAVVTRGDEEVGLNADRLAVDVAEFDRAVDEGRLLTAVDLYRGPILSGVFLRGCPEFEYWLDGQRGRRSRAYEEAIEQLAAGARTRGAHRRAADWLGRLVQMDPCSGRAAYLLMDALAAAGAREEAIRVGEKHIADLQREFEAAPDARIEELLDRLRQPPGPVSLPSTTAAGPPRLVVELLREALAPRYDVQEELGSGIMAKVYLTWDTKLRRHVALKVLRPEYRRTIGADRFLQEVELIARFSHPNIIELFDADEAGGFLYFTMRHCPGEPLDALIRQEGYLSVRHAVGVAADVGNGLAYAHREGVVHRDVKPSNILLHEGVGLIADFGIALIVTAGGRRLTESGLLVGTPEYMSPEQADPKAVVDARSDVYALGCVVYEMITGEPVFSGATPQAVMARHQFETVPSIRIVRPEVPEGIEALVTQALAKRPADRFASMAEFVGQLEAAGSEDGRRMR